MVLFPDRLKSLFFVLIFLLFAVTLSAQNINRPAAATDIIPVVRLEKQLMSIDYFGQYLWGDEIFEDYLYRIYRLDQGPFNPGEGITVEATWGGGIVRIEQALLAVENNSNWWMLQISGDNIDIYCEVEVHSLGVPLRVRYRNPETGAFHERSTILGQGLEDAIKSMGSDTILAEIDKEKNQDLDSIFRRQYPGMNISGITRTTSPIGPLDALEAVNEMEGSGRAVYLLSKEVPGGLISIILEKPGTVTTFAEIVDKRDDYFSRISEADLVPEKSEEAPEDFYSEGTIEDPVPVDPESYQAGSVGYGGVSYYSITVPYDMDLSVELSELSGYAELYDYGKDETFWLLQSSVSGTGSLSLEYSGIKAGTVLYFSVEDIEDEYAEGEGYTIEVYGY